MSELSSALENERYLACDDVQKGHIIVARRQSSEARLSGPLMSTKKKALAKASAFFNDVCLRQMMKLR